MKKIVFITLAALLLFGMLPTVGAQPCTGHFPFVDVEIGDSWCLQVVASIPPCPFAQYGFFLVGTPGTGAADLPILTFGAGCNPLNTNCETDCTPLTPPSGDWVLGGHPSGFYPLWYYIGNSCIEIITQPAHNPPDNVWIVTLVSHCTGCFCMTFDHQLPVELLDFTAVAGDEEVMLNWRTASESNTDHFEIARGGEMLTEIGASNTPTGASYSWTDNSVVNGNVYTYSLYSISANGSRELLGEAEASPTFNAGTVTEYALYQNYPNPFNPETQITFDLVESGFVSLRVVNLLGQEVAVIANGDFSAGRHVVNFNESNLTSGVYLYTMSAGDFSAAKKLVLLK